MNEVASEQVSATRSFPITGLSRNVILLGVVSFFADISSEMVYPIIPLFLTGTLGAPVLAVGIIEGIAESTASLLKFVFGWLSDKFRRRVPFTVAGYGIAALAKPGLALAFAWPAVLFMRFLDRAGKGIRTAPRQKRLATFVQADMDGPLTNRRRMTAVRSIQLGSLQRSHEISRRKTVAPFTLDPVLSHRVALR